MKHILRAVFQGVALGAMVAGVHAQLADDLRERLNQGGIVSQGGWVYALATGSVRGTVETEEARQATRAMQIIARSLCNFEPTPGRRLEVGLKGLSMVSSVQRGRDLEVVMRVPIQKPECRVVLVHVPPPSVPASVQRLAPGGVDAASERSGSIRVLEPTYTRENNLTIRVLNGEY